MVQATSDGQGAATEVTDVYLCVCVCVCALCVCALCVCFVCVLCVLCYDVMCVCMCVYSYVITRIIKSVMNLCI